jgi:hypothetical protein
MDKSKLIFILGFSSLLMSCSGGSDSSGSLDSQLISSDVAYAAWPNSTTTKTNSNQITSPVLLSDINKDGVLENIFITVLPASTQPENSVLRVTSGEDYEEIINYDANRTPLFQNSYPFVFDVNDDGDKELILVGYDLDKVYCFDFKDNELDQIYIRWSARLPQGLPADFNPRMKLIEKDEQVMIQIENYGIFEKKHRKPKVVFINPPGKDKNDDDDD